MFLLFITTENGSGWVSRGKSHLTSNSVFAARFDSPEDAEAAIDHLRTMQERRECGWEDGAEITGAELLPEDWAGERVCVHADPNWKKS